MFVTATAVDADVDLASVQLPDAAVERPPHVVGVEERESKAGAWGSAVANADSAPLRVCLLCGLCRGDGRTREGVAQQVAEHPRHDHVAA